MEDRADLKTNRLMDRLERDLAQLYNEAVKRAIRKNARTLKALEAVNDAKPPSYCRTITQQNDWRKREKRRIQRQSGLAKDIAQEVSASGTVAAVMIQKAMEQVDDINREAFEDG